MEKAINDHLPELLDQTIFKTQSFSDVIRTQKENFDYLDILGRPIPKSYGSFKTNTQSILGTDSTLQRCHSFLSGTHDVPVSRINISFKSRFSKDSSKYENQKIEQIKKLGNLVTKTLGDDNLNHGSVKRGAFGELYFGIFSIPAEFLLRIFPFENVSFFTNLKIDPTQPANYFDEEGPFLKSIMSLSESYDHALKRACHQTQSDPSDTVTLFNHHLNNSTKAVTNLKAFAQTFESFGKSKQLFTIEQIYEFFSKIHDLPVLISLDFVSHLLLNTCLDDEHSVETYQKLMDRESWRLISYKQIQVAMPKVLATLSKNLLRLNGKNQLSKITKKHPQFNLLLTQLQMSKAADMEKMIEEKAKAQSKNANVSTSENNCSQNVNSPKTPSKNINNTDTVDIATDPFEGDNDNLELLSFQVTELSKVLNEAMTELAVDYKPDPLDPLDTLYTSNATDRVRRFLEDKQRVVSLSLETAQQINESIAATVNEQQNTHCESKRDETKSHTSAISDELNIRADNLKRVGIDPLDSSVGPAQTPRRLDLLIQPNLEGPGGSSKDKTARDEDISRSLNVSNKTTAKNTSLSSDKKSPLVDAHKTPSVLNKIKVDNSMLESIASPEEFDTANDQSSMLYRTAQSRLLTDSEQEKSPSSTCDGDDDEDCHDKFSGLQQAHTSTPAFSLRRPKLQFQRAGEIDITPVPSHPPPEANLCKINDSNDEQTSKKANNDLKNVTSNVSLLAKASTKNSHNFSKYLNDAEDDIFTDKIMKNIKKTINPAPPVRSPRKDSGLGRSVRSTNSDSSLFPLFPPIDEASFNKKVKAATSLNRQALASRSDTQEADKERNTLLKNEVKSYNERERQLQLGREEMEQTDSDSNYISVAITSYYNDFEDNSESETDSASVGSSADSACYTSSENLSVKSLVHDHYGDEIDSLSQSYKKLEINDSEIFPFKSINYRSHDSNAIHVQLDNDDDDTKLTMDQVSEILKYYELQKNIVQHLEEQLQKLKDMMSKAQSGNDPTFNKAEDYNRLYGVYLSVQQQLNASVKVLNTQKKVLEKCMKSIDSQQQEKMKSEAKMEKQSEMATIMKGFRETVQDMVKDIFSPKLVDQITPVKFSGHINDFENFWNLFDVAVHSNTRYKNRPKDKLVQLKSCVQHLRACSEITEMKIEDHNYAEAVSILKRIYNNPEERLKFTNNRLSNKLYAVENSKDLINVYDYFGLDFIIKAFVRYLDDIMLCIDQRLHHGVAHVEKIAKKLPTKELLKWQKSYESVQNKRNEKSPITIMAKGKLVQKPVTTNDIADQQLITDFVFFLNELKKVARKYHAARGNSVDSPYFSNQKSYIKIKHNNCTVSCNLADPKTIERIDKLNHVDVNQKPDLFINAIQARATGSAGPRGRPQNPSSEKSPPFKKFKNSARKNSNRRKKTARSRDFNYQTNNSQTSKPQANNAQTRSRSRPRSRNTFPSSSAAIQRRISRTSRASASRNRSSNRKGILKPPQTNPRNRSRSQSTVRFSGKSRNTSVSRSKTQNPNYVKTGPTNGNVSKLPSQNIAPANPTGGAAKHASAIVHSQSNNNQQNKKPPAKKKSGFPKGTVKCLFCRTTNDHITAYCTNKNMSPQQRQTIAIQNKLCLNCLFNGHRAAECRKRPCEISGCSLKHHKLLHDDTVRFSRKSNGPPNRSKQMRASSNVVNMQVHPSLDKSTPKPCNKPIAKSRQ